MPDTIDTQNYLRSLIDQAITIMLHADGDRDHMNHSNLTCEQSMAIVELLRRCNTAITLPPDWKIVPDRATEEMWQAGRSADVHRGDSYSAIYLAMIEAAPEPEVALASVEGK